MTKPEPLLVLDGVVAGYGKMTILNGTTAQIRRGAQRDMGRRIERAIAEPGELRQPPALFGRHRESALRRHARQRHGLQPVAIGGITGAVGTEQRQHQPEPLRHALRVDPRGTRAGAGPSAQSAARSGATADGMARAIPTTANTTRREAA